MKLFLLILAVLALTACQTSPPEFPPLLCQFLPDGLHCPKQ